MRQRRFIVVASCVALVSIGSMTAFVKSADEAKKSSAEEQQKMMEMWMKLAQPGAEHQRLQEQFAGEWTAAVKACSGDPSAPMVESEGTMSSNMVLGGRYLIQDYSGKMGDQSFHGLGMMGFDNASKKYIAAWIDEMSTGMMSTEGSYDESTKTYTLTGTVNDPSKPDGKAKVREVIKVTDNDHHQMMLYMPGPDGNEMLMIDINYSRKQ